MRMSRKPGQTRAAENLQDQTGLPQDRDCSLNDIGQFENVLNARVIVFSARFSGRIVRIGDDQYEDQLYVYYREIEGRGHFDTIVSPAGFWGQRKFCRVCLKGYEHLAKHKCVKTACKICKSPRCTQDRRVTCEDCNAHCPSQQCYREHKKGGPGGGKSICQQVWYCPDCRSKVYVEKRSPDLHRCGEFYCNNCAAFVMGSDHICHLTPLNPPAPKEKFIFFDFESMIMDDGVHQPNLCVAQICCRKCVHKEMDGDSKCYTCGYRCSMCNEFDEKNHDYANMPCERCERSGKAYKRQVVFEGSNTAQEFCEWLFAMDHKGYTVISHNGGAYDNIWLVDFLIRNGVDHQIIYSGARIMYVNVKSLSIRLLDSLNFLPMPLAKLPEAWGLKELCKGYFPYLANTPQHQSYKGEYFAPEFYDVDHMMPKARKQFMEWYPKQAGKEFDLQKEMLNYCISDTQILRQACLKFRKLMLEVTGGELKEVRDSKTMNLVKKWVGGVDPFCFITIASTCMGVYRSQFLEADLEVITTKEAKDAKREKRPPVACAAKRKGGKTRVWVNGRWKTDVPLDSENFVSSPLVQTNGDGISSAMNFSMESIDWLEWYMWKERREGRALDIEHALNRGEYRIPGTRYHADGYDRESGTVLEYNGCFVHACPTCYPDRDMIHPRLGVSMETVYAMTQKKESVIREKGYNLVSVWEHEYRAMLKEDPEMMEYVASLDHVDRLRVRDAFHGGRTNAFRLYYRVENGERIYYLDFTSLYPSVNKQARYMVGAPRVITRDFDPDLKNYFGFVKCRILPPRGLYHPVLPRVSGGKLKFPLCAKCGDNEQTTPCRCPDSDRAFVGTFCTPELGKALDLGYQVLKTFEVYHWDNTTQYDPVTRTGGLFATYVDTFLKLKQESSGWPEWCHTDEDRQKYLEDYQRVEGIRLDPGNINKNPGMRSLAKLCLNSFWGKFGQRDRVGQSTYLRSEEELLKFITDPSKQMDDFHILNDSTALVEWKYDEKFVPRAAVNNVYIAAMTTSWARLRLYEVLQSLQTRALYCDTDSVLFKTGPGEQCPETGDYLGDLTSELPPGVHIDEFVSGGPKNYAYHQSDGKTVCKVRGFTLNFENAQQINFDTMREMVLSKDQVSPIVTVNPRKICRNKIQRKVFNRREERRYGIVYTKRVVGEDLNTLPYGY